jgi:hypothetical protein
MGAIADWTKSYDPGLMIAGLMPWIGVVSLRLLWKNPDATGPGPGGHSA